MDFNNPNNKNDKNKFRSKSLANNFLVNLSKTEKEKRSSNILSSVSKKTPGFNDRLNFFHRTSKRLLSQTMKNDEFVKFHNSNQMNKSQEISMQNIQNIHDKSDVNVNCTNINISIVNPNFSINNFEPRHSAANINNNKINVNIVNSSSLLSFNDNNDKIEKNESKTKSEFGKSKILSSIYKDYLENKSQDESFSANFDENLKKKFKKYLSKNKIVQHEYKTEGIISGFAAYMYPNEENVNKDKICLNINIDKSTSNKNNKKEKNLENNSHIINYFSLFCGGKNDPNDELPKILKNKLKDMILNNKDIIKNPEYAIKKGLFNSEIDYINYFLEEKINEPSNFFKIQNDKQNRIPHCSVLILLNIDDNFYIGNIGKIITILSSNFSKKINYLSREQIIPNLNNDEEKNNNIPPLNNNFFDDNIKKDIEDFNNYNDDASNNNILTAKDGTSIFNNSISNKIFPLLNLKRIFPGNTLHKIINKGSNSNRNGNSQITSLEIYDKYKRRSSATIINLINVMNNQKIKNSKLSNHINDSYKMSKTGISNSTKFLPYIIRNNNLFKQNLNESLTDKKIISSYPDILSFKYQENHDFILICSKKIINHLGYDKICKGVYETMKKCLRKSRSFEIFLGCVVKDIIKKSISLGITTNISCIFICFELIKNLYLKNDINLIENELVSFYLTSNHNKRIQLYNDFLNTDLINMDKAFKYERKIKSEIDKLNKKKKSVLSAVNINEGNQILINNFVNNDTNKTMNIKLKDNEIKKKKRCCC